MTNELLVATWSVPWSHLREGSSLHGIVASRCACSLKRAPCHTMVVITRTYVSSAKASATVTHLHENKRCFRGPQARIL